MRRITVDEVRAAYEKTGLTPVRHMWLSDNCACALTACMLSSGVQRKEIALAEQQWACDELASTTLGLDEAYTDFFTSGFDGCRLGTVTEEEGYGYQDGRAVAAAIFGEVQS